MVAQLRACSAKSRAASVGAVEFWPGPYQKSPLHLHFYCLGFVCGVFTIIWLLLC